MNRMRGYLHAICVISFAVCVLPVYAQPVNDTANNINEARRFLGLHNAARSAASLQPLTWNNSLAATAQSLVNSCIWDDFIVSPTATWYLGGRTDNLRSPEELMGAYVNQARYLVNGQTHHCCSDDIRRCCHYARIINPEFRSLGCGKNICNLVGDGFTFYDVYTLVCYYSNS